MAAAQEPEPAHLADRRDPPRLHISEVHGDLLEQPVAALVNPWNRNFVPRWLLPPSGVSGQMKRRTGPEPWRELARAGPLALGEAVVTGTGRMERPAHLIHVAGLHAFWRASERSIHLSARNAVLAAAGVGARSLAMPLIGAGTGGVAPARARIAIGRAMAEFDQTESAEAADIQVLIVSFDKTRVPR